MTLIEAVKAGKIKIQNNHRYMFWDGYVWVVQRKFRGQITPISKTSSEELAVQDLLKEETKNEQKGN